MESKVQNGYLLLADISGFTSFMASSELEPVYCGHLGVNETSWWKSRKGLNKTTVEIEAESVSFLVCKRVGRQTTSESYLSNYISNHNEIPPISFDTILTVSGYIEKMGTNSFRSKQKKKEE